MPEDAVAEVGDAKLTKSDFERELRLMAGGRDDPRDLDACVETEREKAARKPGVATPTQAQLKQQCKEEYEELRHSAIDHLIQEEWIRQEAEERDIVVTRRDIDLALDKARESGFLGNLERSGLTVQELIPNVRETQLELKVTKDLTAGSGEVSAGDIGDYYREHKAELIVKERRDVRLVLTKTRARADGARAALEGGQSWATVAREYSLHESSRDNGGRVTDLRKGPVVNTGLTSAVFRARKDELSGPIKGDRFSWAVFVVEEIKPAFQASLEQATDEIRGLLASQRRQGALADFTEKYREMTTCAPGFEVSSCKNGPAETEEQTGA